MLIRDAIAADAAAIASIYGHHVLTGTATFETVPPTPAEMAVRIARVQDAGWPWLIAEGNGDGPDMLLGYAYCSQFRDRPAYAYTCESSVYLRDDRRGRGIGRALMGELIDRAEAAGCRQMIAVIGDSGNAASIGLHSARGFTRAGVIRDVGSKFGRWLDVVYMQRAIGDGPTNTPAGR